MKIHKCERNKIVEKKMKTVLFEKNRKRKLQMQKKLQLENKLHKLNQENLQSPE